MKILARATGVMGKGVSSVVMCPTSRQHHPSELLQLNQPSLYVNGATAAVVMNVDSSYMHRKPQPPRLELILDSGAR